MPFSSWRLLSRVLATLDPGLPLNSAAGRRKSRATFFPIHFFRSFSFTRSRVSFLFYQILHGAGFFYRQHSNPGADSSLPTSLSHFYLRASPSRAFRDLSPPFHFEAPPAVHLQVTLHLVFPFLLKFSNTTSTALRLGAMPPFSFFSISPHTLPFYPPRSHPPLSDRNTFAVLNLEYPRL